MVGSFTHFYNKVKFNNLLVNICSEAPDTFIETNKILTAVLSWTKKRKTKCEVTTVAGSESTCNSIFNGLFIKRFVLREELI